MITLEVSETHAPSVPHAVEAGNVEPLGLRRGRRGRAGRVLRQVAGAAAVPPGPGSGRRRWLRRGDPRSGPVPWDSVLWDSNLAQPGAAASAAGLEVGAAALAAGGKLASAGLVSAGRAGAGLDVGAVGLAAGAAGHGAAGAVGTVGAPLDPPGIRRRQFRELAARCSGSHRHLPRPRNSQSRALL